MSQKNVFLQIFLYSGVPGLISTESCLPSDLIFNAICCKIFLYGFIAVFTLKVSMSKFDFCLTTSNIKVSSTFPFVNCGFTDNTETQYRPTRVYSIYRTM